MQDWKNMDKRFNQVKVLFSTFNQVKVSKFGKGRVEPSIVRYETEKTWKLWRKLDGHRRGSRCLPNKQFIAGTLALTNPIHLLTCKTAAWAGPTEHRPRINFKKLRHEVLWQLIGPPSKQGAAVVQLEAPGMSNSFCKKREEIASAAVNSESGAWPEDHKPHNRGYWYLTTLQMQKAADGS